MVLHGQSGDIKAVSVLDITCFITNGWDGARASLEDLKDEESSRELDWTMKKQA